MKESQGKLFLLNYAKLYNCDEDTREVKNELHNRDLHIRGSISQNQKNDPIKHENDPIKDPIKQDELSKREAEILKLLKQTPTLTRSKMAEILGCSDATVKRALKSMVEKNVIRRIGSNKKGEWVIVG